MSLGDHLPALRRLPTDELRRRLTATYMYEPTHSERDLARAIALVLAERSTTPAADAERLRAAVLAKSVMVTLD